MNDRAETGPMEFEDDWRGVFLRGDYAGPLSFYWAEVSAYLNNPNPTKEDRDRIALPLVYINGLMKILADSNQFADVEVQKMKAFKNCVKDDEL